MSDNINNTDNITTDPIIDNTGCCIDPDTNTKIYNCTISDDLRFISGYTEEGQKARYSYKDHKWYYGHDIAKLYLIPFNQLDKEEHLKLSSKGGTKTQDNIREEANLNNIAKKMLNAVMSESQIDEILGDAQTLIGEDRSAGAVMIAKMIQTACAGSFKAAEFVRDTAGYKPETRSSLDISADIMTDADRSLLEKIERRIG